MTATLRIAVAEPSIILRNGVISVLQQLPGLNIHVVEIREPEQLAVSLCNHRPDILLVNPASPGLPPVHRLRQQTGCREMRCVALLTALTDRESLKAFDESMSLDDSVEQIAGKLQRLVSAPAARREPAGTLSVREREIVVCIVKGMTNKQIAEKLFISTHTVITHRRNVAAKLQIHSPAGLTIYAIVNRLVDLDDIRGTIPDGGERPGGREL